MRREFRMPDAGEGLTEAEVLAWRVAPGDVIEVNQILLEIETAKAAVELPSPYAGTVLELLVAEGEVVEVGTPIIAIDEGASAGPPQPPEGQAAPANGSPARSTETGSAPVSVNASIEAGPDPAAVTDAPVEQASARTAEAFRSEPAEVEPAATRSPADAEAPAQPKREAVLVGYGVRAGGVPRRRERLGPHGVARPEPGPPGEAAKPVRHGGLEQARAVESRLAEGAPRAKPPVRRLARDLGVDLVDVIPTGPHGTITHDDVTGAAQRRLAPAGEHRERPGEPWVAPAATAPLAAPLGRVGVPPAPVSMRDADRVPLSHVARMMSRAMTASAFSAPHVTEWVDVDVTATTRLIASARAHPGWRGRSITPLTVAALGLVRAAQEFPTVNASLDGDDLLVHRHVHLGIAVDSPRGLVVPHIPEAETLDLPGMAAALSALIETARAGRSRPDQLRGSTITLTNVGVFGVDGGTPILNPGESAILALGRVLPRPWVVEGVVTVRNVVTLALSFDHRVVDGALGSRVLRRVADFLEDPGTALALG
jgi:2-oxoisovalerate dehydrogenase E2 component (dihydrolipoyl transacylase)